MNGPQRQQYLLTAHEPYAPQPSQIQALQVTHRHAELATGIVYTAGSFLTALLGLRFMFALLSANAANGFASFVYGFTAPFVAPFYNLFSYDHAQLGVASFQGYTLVAMFVYSLAAAGFARILALVRH